ncbi:MAG: deoxyribodipyrimidine photo-lyase [Pelagimonas sp.]|jgi:deoxyribodipyrimidine photo-lyase|nr:deoxyribodipyrimidine photo-lyase [Pelagimonas sp.]
MKPAPHIVWFKRDLRVHDHLPLFQAVQSGAPVIPLYIVEPELWQQPFASSRHWQFIHDCLSDLNASLNRLGQPLIIRIGNACNVLVALADQTGAQTIWAHEETADLWTYRRDLAVHDMCRARGLTFRELPSNGVVRRLKSRDDWSRIRNQRMAADIVPKPGRLIPVDCASDPLPPKAHPMFGPALPQPQRGGRRAAIDDLRSFYDLRARGYLRHISSPLASEYNCSRLSAHLAWGSLSVREVVQALKRCQSQLSPLEKPVFGRNLSAFGSRLA